MFTGFFYRGWTQKIAKLSDNEETVSENKAPACQHDLLPNLDFLTESTHTHTTATPKRHGNESPRVFILTEQPGVQSENERRRQVSVRRKTNDAPIH